MMAPKMPAAMMMMRLLRLRPPHLPSGFPQRSELPTKEEAPNEEIPDGIVPLSLFPETEKVFRRLRSDNLDGIVPESLFPESKSVLR